MAKCPSTIRALSLSRPRQSRSLTGPQTETIVRIARPLGIGPGPGRRKPPADGPAGGARQAATPGPTDSIRVVLP